MIQYQNKQPMTYTTVLLSIAAVVTSFLAGRVSARLDDDTKARKANALTRIDLR